MNKSTLLILFSLTASFNAICQESANTLSDKNTRDIFYLNKPGIRKITITDSFVVKAIKKIIVEKKLKDSVFKKYGYIEINRLRVIRDSNSSHKEFCLRISPDYFYYYTHYDSERFPLYYTEIGGKLVVFFDYLIKQDHLSLKQKKKFVRLANKSLEPPVPLKIVTDDGRKLTLWPSGEVSLHNGITICR
jgi:hypothetical protein